MSPPDRPAFTLVELLVVITIIVILLALLVPAMDQAIYQAELAVCAGRLKTVGTGVTVYAMDFGRNYPYRPWVFQGGVRPNRLWNRAAGVFDKDERPMIRPYVGRINEQVQCPFNTEMNLDQEGSVNPATESNQAWASYYLLYGWGYHANKVFDNPMRKIGDRFEYTTTGANNQAITDSFDILASDYDMLDLNTYPNGVGSHPDKGPNAVMFQYVLEDQSAVTYPVSTPGTIITISRWAARSMRAPIDMNFVHADGSVSRLKDVVYESRPNEPDERMARILETSNKSGTFYTHLPPAR